MLNKTTLLAAAAVFCSLSPIAAQTKTKSISTGHVVTFDMPEYMDPTVGLNAASFLQYANVVKDVYSYAVEDAKSDLVLAELKYASLKEYYDDFIKDFLTEEEKKNLTTAKEFTKNGVKYIQSDVVYFNAEIEKNIYYSMTVAETPTYFYKILSFTSADNSEAYKADFFQLASSLKEVNCK
jgi:hypothetical protein